MKNKISIIIVLPKYAIDFPEKFGGGYVRFKHILPHLQKNLNLVLFEYENRSSILCYHLLRVLYHIRRVRRSRGLAVLVVNPSPIDVWIGYLISIFSKIPLVVFVNANPLSGFVGFESVTFNHLPTIVEIWRILRNSRKPFRVKIAGILHFYILFRSLKKSVIIPLTPDIAANTEKLGYTYVNLPIGVGCMKCSENMRSQRIWDAIYVASPLHPDKGLYDAIIIWELVTKKIPTAKLIIAGKQDPFFNINHAKEYILKKKLDKNVILFSNKWLPHQTVLKLMTRCKLFLYPSRKDQTPLVISEALSLGIPVVTYDLPGIKYAYGSCSAVIRVKVGDHHGAASEVVKLLKEDFILEKLTQAALKWCNENSWDVVARRTIIACLKAVLMTYVKKKKVA